MIRLDTISKQNGQRLVFIEASAALQKGEKTGLVGPNGAGKTTLFRLITGQEQPDEGQILVERGVSIGLFSQDVGEMAGHSAVAAVMEGAGAVSAVAAELAALEAAMADPDQADRLDAIIEDYGQAQARFEALGGYALDGRAREVLHGLGFSQEMMDADVGKLSGGWKMRVALGRILLMRPDVMLLDEPSNHLDLESLIWLEQFLAGYDGALMMTSHDREFMNRVVNKVIEIDGGSLTEFAGDYAFYEQQRALAEKHQQAQFERQQAMLAKEINFIARFKARASHAAQVQSRVKKLEKIDRIEPGDLSGPGPAGAAAGALLRARRERRRQIHAAQAGGRHHRAGRRLRHPRRRREDGLFRAARDGAAGGRTQRVRNPGGGVPARRPGRLARAGGRLRVFRRRDRKALPRALRRREGAIGDGADTV
jgi:ATPase subunit of ABC transporter with duplicated ATPase domains